MCLRGVRKLEVANCDIKFGLGWQEKAGGGRKKSTTDFFVPNKILVLKKGYLSFYLKVKAGLFPELFCYLGDIFTG
jgi:hypothetical protein